jgi:hypothetical protein
MATGSPRGRAKDSARFTAPRSGETTTAGDRARSHVLDEGGTAAACLTGEESSPPLPCCEDEGDDASTRPAAMSSATTRAPRGSVPSCGGPGGRSQ